jgi:hypothetical protein
VLEIFQLGQDLIKFIPDAVGAIKVYEFGKQQYDIVQGFIGKKQMENAAKLSVSASKKLKRVRRERLSEPSPNVLTPLIEGAIQESREEIQDLWAALLANSMIDKGVKVRREYLEVVKKLEPEDVLVLRIIHRPVPPDYPTVLNQLSSFQAEQYRQAGLSDDLWNVCSKSLTDLGCVITLASNQAKFLTPLARMLLAACEVT